MQCRPRACDAAPNPPPDASDLLTVRPLCIQRPDVVELASCTLLAFMQFSRQQSLLRQAPFESRQPRKVRDCSTFSKPHSSDGQLCADQLLGACGLRSSTVPGCQSRPQRLSGHTNKRTVPTSCETPSNGARRVVTRAASVAAPAFGETDLWPWRKAQLHKIAMFTGPALSIPLADPIMSLVDTVCIGQVSGQFAVCALAGKLATKAPA